MFFCFVFPWKGCYYYLLLNFTIKKYLIYILKILLIRTGDFFHIHLVNSKDELFIIVDKREA